MLEMPDISDTLIKYPKAHWLSQKFHHQHPAPRSPKSLLFLQRDFHYWPVMIIISHPPIHASVKFCHHLRKVIIILSPPCIDPPTKTGSSFQSIRERPMCPTILSTNIILSCGNLRPNLLSPSEPRWPTSAPIDVRFNFFVLRNIWSASSAKRTSTKSISILAILVFLILSNAKFGIKM